MQQQDTSSANHRRSHLEQMQSNRQRLRWALIAYFAIAVFAGNITGKAFLFMADPNEYYAERYGVGLDGMTGPDRRLFSYVNQVTVAMLLLAWVNYRRMNRCGDSIILGLAGARPLKDQQFLNTGEELALAAGIETPGLYITENAVPNAFACGRADGAASIVLTRGLLERLSRAEIQAVVAHEMAHIKNGDARLMTVLLGMGRAFHLISAFALGPFRAFFDASRMADQSEESEAHRPAVVEKPPPRPTVTNQAVTNQAVTNQAVTARSVLLTTLATPLILFGLLIAGLVVTLIVLFTFSMLITLFPWFVMALALWEFLLDQSPGLRDAIRRRSAGQKIWWGGLAFLVPVGLMAGPAILILGIVVPSLLLLLRLAVSRNREFQADATAVALTRNPGALLSALRKMQDARDHEPGNQQLPAALSPLTIVASRRQWISELGLDWLNSLISTHPPLEDRIARLAAMER